MTPVISPLLKAHITRLNGSRGSGTDLGRITVSAAGEFVKPTAGSCPRANGERHNDRTTRTASAELRILRPGWIFKSLAFLALRRKSFWASAFNARCAACLCRQPGPAPAGLMQHIFVAISI